MDGCSLYTSQYRVTGNETPAMAPFAAARYPAPTDYVFKPGAR